MKLLDGKKLSQEILQKISIEVEEFKKKQSRPPGLAVILLGDDPASAIYVKNKIRACQQVGFYSVLKKCPQSISKMDLKKHVEQLNNDKNIHGILIQLPLPPDFNEKEILSWIDPKKDVDGLTLENKALFWSGQPRVIPCTVQGIMDLLKHYDIPIKGQKALVVGRSQIVGLPLFQQLLSHQATVTVAHSQTRDLPALSRTADIVVLCTGKKGLLGKEDLKKGGVVVDVGIYREGQKLYGDVRREGLDGHLFALSPVPGGVGPMTIAGLLKNGLHLACLSNMSSVSI